jgi:hypothetical protein
VRFTALHVSLSMVEDGWVFALADRADGDGPRHVLLSFSENEDDQDRTLGLTGLFLATNWDGPRGYGLVESVSYDGDIVTVQGRSGAEDLEITIATDMLSKDELNLAVQRCNKANATKPE